MPLTLEQYASYLDTRDLPWPAPPPVDQPKVKPHLKPLPAIRAVTWNIYGTLLAISGGDLVFRHPNAFIMKVALDKTVQEFKMWGSMVRKPGQPADYLEHMYNLVYDEQRLAPSGAEKYPEVAAERVWEGIVKKLLQKEYQFDTSFYGSLNEFSRKVAYFFHASLQGTGCYSGAALVLQEVAGAGLKQALVADGQCFTTLQLQRGLAEQEAVVLDELIPPDRRILSHGVRARKPSEQLFRQALQVLGQYGLAPEEILHVGLRLVQDIIPARRLGMKTALFAGDRASLQATPEQLKERAHRPDVLLTELKQIFDVLPGA